MSFRKYPEDSPRHPDADVDYTMRKIELGMYGGTFSTPFCICSEREEPQIADPAPQRHHSEEAFAQQIRQFLAENPYKGEYTRANPPRSQEEATLRRAMLTPLNRKYDEFSNTVSQGVKALNRATNGRTQRPTRDLADSFWNTLRGIRIEATVINFVFKMFHRD